MGAAWVKSRAAPRTRISAANILGDRQSLVTLAAEDRVGLALVSAPHDWGVVSQLLVTMDASIERVAALEFYSDNIAVSVVVRTLSLFIDAGAAHHHLTRTR